MTRRVNVEIIARFDLEGCITPLEIIWEDGRAFVIDKVVASQRALKAGGQGTRYTVMIGGRQAYLFYENPMWFVEGKTDVREI